MNALKALHKLRKMRPAEIRHRLSERARSMAERRAYRRGSAGASANGELLAVGDALPARAVQLVPGTCPSELEALLAASPQLYEELRQQAVQRAEAICCGDYRLFACPVDLSGKVDWHGCPKSGFSWPRAFYADVQVYGRADEVDVKYVWELGRHHFLVELSRAWRFTGEERFAARARELMLDWIENNPLYEGVHWTSALEAAMRSIAWLWTVAALAEWPGWQPNDQRRISQALVEHADYLAHHLSFYSSPYNHLIGEAAALLILGRWLHGCKPAAAWEKLGRGVLAEHGPAQFYGDGFCVEQATGYHFFTLGFLLQASLVARAAYRPLSEVETLLGVALDAAAALKQPDGRWPAIGDVDSARSIPVYTDDFWDFRSLLSLGSVVAGSEKARSAAERPGAELYWLLGTAGVEAFGKPAPQSSVEAVVLGESGYAVATAGKGNSADWLLFDAGPLAHGVHPDATPSAAHGHADALQLLLFRQGQPVLVDSGVPSYAGDRRWIEHFRGAAAHNTLRIEGMPWARSSGGLAWSHLMSTPTLHANLSDEAWLLRGELLLDRDTSIQRYVLRLPDVGVWIADLFRSSAPQTVSWNWQLPGNADPQPQRTEHTGCSYRLGNTTLATWSSATSLAADCHSADPGTPVAWQAPDYGRQRRGYCLTYSVAQTKRLLAATFIGETLVPFTVTVADNHLACGDGAPPPPQAKAYGADVAWHVALDGRARMFAAGTELDPATPGFSALQGIGGWPAACGDPLTPPGNPDTFGTSPLSSREISTG